MYLSSVAWLTGSTRSGRFPPVLFIRKRKMAIVADRTSAGTISTITVNKIENQVSAEKMVLKTYSKNLFSSGVNCLMLMGVIIKDFGFGQITSSHFTLNHGAGFYMPTIPSYPPSPLQDATLPGIVQLGFEPTTSK